MNNKNGNRGINKSITEQNNIRHENKHSTINKRKLMVVLLIMLIVISFIVYKIIMLIINPTATFMVEEGSIYQEETTTGYIIRDEEIVKGKNYKNGMEQIMSEGEKVAKNEPIFRYYSSGEEELEKKISDLDKKIDEAMQKEEESSNIPNGDISSLEQQITEKIDVLYKETDMKKIKEYKDKINDFELEIQTLQNKINEERQIKVGKEIEKSKILSKRKIGSIEGVVDKKEDAPVSGIVSYKIDGYEEILSPDKFNTINKELLEDINIKTGQIIATSDESGKIISDFNFYIACILSSESSKDAEVGDSIKLRFYSGREIPAKIEYISKEDNDRIIIFKVNQDVQDLISYRKISLDIIWWSDSGKKIPNESIAKEQKGENEIPYVIRTRDGYSDKIYVKILRTNNKYSIVTNYTKEELKKLGFTAEEIKSTKTLTIYDEILKEPV